MANQTINGLVATDAALSTDWLPIWKTALGQTRKIAVADLLGGYLTGDGTIVTGGFTATVPRTGTLVTAYSGTWTPSVTGSSSNPTITYTTQTGSYKRLDDLTFCEFTIVINTTSGGSGEFRMPLPFTAANNGQIATNQIAQVGIGGSSGECMVFVSPNTNYAKFRVSATNFQISDLGAGDVVQGSLVYLAAA